MLPPCVRGQLLHYNVTTHNSFLSGKTKLHSSQTFLLQNGTGLSSVQFSRSVMSYSLRRHESIFQCSAFFTVQLSRPYMTTGETIALTRRTLAGKVMSLLFNMLSRLVITFLPRSKHLLISWLQSPSTVISEPPKNKV